MIDTRPGCPLPLQVEVASFHIASEASKWEDSSDTTRYALYTINVAIPILREDWSVSRRFSDFAILRAYLSSIYVAIGPLPSKTLLRNLSDAHMESRRKSLNEWLNVLCGRRDVLGSHTLHHFLGVDVHCQNAYARLVRTVFPQKLSLSEKLLEEDEWDRELTRRLQPQLLGSHTDANFGFKDAIYLRKRKLLLTISADFSIASKVDSLVSSTLSVLTEASIPLSSFGIHSVNFQSNDEKGLEESQARRPVCTGSSDDAQWASVCGNASRNATALPATTETQLVHYFSKRATALTVSPDEEFAVVAFESGTLAVYQHRDAPERHERRREELTESESDEDLISAFHAPDGRHLNRPPDSNPTDSMHFDDASIPAKPTPGFYRDDYDFPLLPQVAGVVRFLEFVCLAQNDSENELFLICGGDDRQVQFYDFGRRRPRPEMTLSFPANPRCISLHEDGRTIAIGFDDESVALVELRGNEEPPRVLCRGSSQRTLTRQCKGEASASTNRVMFVTIIPLPKDRSMLHSRIPASLMLDPDCQSLLISGLKDTSVALWSVKQREGVPVLKLTGRISRPCVDILQKGISGLDKTTLIIGTKQGVVTALCPFDGQPLLSFAAHWRSSALSNFKQGSGHSEGITSMRWITNDLGETVLLSASRDGTANFWSWPVALH